jgi:hypothetical protein
MNTQRRASLKAKLRLETLEDRITPVAIDPATAHVAALQGAILAHTNVVFEKAAGEHHSLSSVKKTVEAHHHKMKTVTHALKIHHHKNANPDVPVATSTVPVTTIPVSYQPTVVSTSNPTSPSPSSGNSNSNSGGTTASANPSGGFVSPSSASSPSVTSPLPANVAEPLQVIDQEFQASSGSSSFTSSYSGTIQIQGSSVGVEIHGNGGDFATLVSDMDKLGLTGSISDANTQTITGLIPIDNLAKAANDSLTLSITPEFLDQASGL